MARYSRYRIHGQFCGLSHPLQNIKRKKKKGNEKSRSCEYGQGQLMLLSTYLTFLASILQSCLYHNKLKNFFCRQFCHNIVSDTVLSLFRRWLESGQAREKKKKKQPDSVKCVENNSLRK